MENERKRKIKPKRKASSGRSPRRCASKVNLSVRATNTDYIPVQYQNACHSAQVGRWRQCPRFGRPAESLGPDLHLLTRQSLSCGGSSVFYVVLCMYGLFHLYIGAALRLNHLIQHMMYGVVRIRLDCITWISNHRQDLVYVYKIRCSDPLHLEYQLAPRWL